MTDLSNKVALATGSAPGIGKAFAERFGRLGARVTVHSASKEPAQETAATIKRKVPP